MTLVYVTNLNIFIFFPTFFKYGKFIVLNGEENGIATCMLRIAVIFSMTLPRKKENNNRMVTDKTSAMLTMTFAIKSH